MLPHTLVVRLVKPRSKVAVFHRKSQSTKYNSYAGVYCFFGNKYGANHAIDALIQRDVTLGPLSICPSPLSAARSRLAVSPKFNSTHPLVTRDVNYE